MNSLGKHPKSDALKTPTGTQTHPYRQDLTGMTYSNTQVQDAISSVLGLHPKAERAVCKQGVISSNLISSIIRKVRAGRKKPECLNGVPVLYFGLFTTTLLLHGVNQNGMLRLFLGWRNTRHDLDGRIFSKMRVYI